MLRSQLILASKVFNKTLANCLERKQILVQLSMQIIICYYSRQVMAPYKKSYYQPQNFH
jgi:hypothetical protein